MSVVPRMVRSPSGPPIAGGAPRGNRVLDWVHRPRLADLDPTGDGLVAMVLVRLTSRGPAIYRQTRLGLGGRPFTIYKIRTMYHDCERLTGPQWSTTRRSSRDADRPDPPGHPHRRASAALEHPPRRDEPGGSPAGAARDRRGSSNKELP